MGRRVAFFGVAVAAASLAAAGCRPSPRERTPTTVRVAVVEAAATKPPSRYGGTVRAATQVELAFKVGGYVRSVARAGGGRGARLVQEGDRVAKGAVLAMLRQDDYALRVSELEGARAQAEAALKQAAAERDRATRLLAEGAIARADYDATVTRHEAALAARRAAKAGAGGASVLLGDTRLRAPFDGVVLRRDVELGELVGPGKTGFVLADVDTVKIAFAVPDSVAASLALGAEIALRVEALPGRRWAAKVTKVAPSADERTRSFGIEAEIGNGDHALKVGMVTDVELEVPALPPRPAVPLGAVVRPPGASEGFVVYVVEEGEGGPVVRARPVTLASLAGGKVALAEGVRAGERVVSIGASLVVDGERVEPVP